MGCSWARSRVIAAHTSRWPRVSWNGSRSSNAATRPSGRAIRGTAGIRRKAARRRASATCRTNASSHFSRSRAAAMSACDRGRWIFSRAARSSSRPRRSRMSFGSGSSTGPSVSKAMRTHWAIFQEGIAALAGYTGMISLANASAALSSVSSSTSM